MNLNRQRLLKALNLTKCSKCLRKDVPSHHPFRSRRAFTTLPPLSEAGVVAEPAVPPQASEPLDPSRVYTTEDEALLARQGKVPIGSRRRRAAMATSPGLAFEQLPYECFQEARKIIAEYRAEKTKLIEDQWARIQRFTALVEEGGPKAPHRTQAIADMKRKIQQLTIEADIYSPRAKMIFEDGLGDLNKPLYRHLADKKWREMSRPIVMQRITQMNVVPDVLPMVDPVASVKLQFSRVNVQSGSFLDSRLTQFPPNISVHVYDAGPRLVSVCFIDSDVPSIDQDSFTHRCHGFYTNIEISPTVSSIRLGGQAQAENTIVPWIPPHAQQGLPYHRISVWVLEHRNGQKLDADQLKETASQIEGDFQLRLFLKQHPMKLAGVNMFRCQFDEGTKMIMREYGLPGVDVEFKRKPSEKLPYKKKDGARYRGFQ